MKSFKNRAAAERAIWLHIEADDLVEQHALECIKGKLVVSYYDISGAKNYL